jgi:adenylate cyclase
MYNFFHELKRGNVIKAAIAYMVAAWVLLQVVSLVLPIINALDWVLKTFTFFLALTFPIWIIFSWVYEITPEGIKKT